MKKLSTCIDCGNSLMSSIAKPICHPCRRVRNAARVAECPHCGQEFNPGRSGNLRTYCSRACNYSARRRSSDRVCEVCGETFNRRLGSNDAGRCCSRQCGFELQRRERKPPVTEWRCLVEFTPCLHCGDPLTHRVGSPTRKWCSRACYRRGSGMVARGEQVETQCPCGQRLTYELKSNYRSDCDDCRAIRTRANRAKARAKARREGRRVGHGHRKRARFYGVEYEPIQPRYIYERDNWICHLCHKKVKKSHSPTGYDPMGPSLDHIIPMSLGGPHLKTNVALAHFICNSIKSDGAANEQLLLVG